MTFNSEVRNIGTVEFPTYTGIRVMMMPFHLHDVNGSLPAYLAGWRSVISSMVNTENLLRTGWSKGGPAYLTIDEANVRRGETHRRPGLHVDGIGPDGTGPGGWGGGGGYGKCGMLMASNVVGCVAWSQSFTGTPGPDGACGHLASQLRDDAKIMLMPGSVYYCEALTVHQALPMVKDCERSFIRISMPSNAPWYEGYTENPLGIKPAGPIHARRSAQMEYRE